MKTVCVILPRFIRLKDAPQYLGMDRNRFNREVRPLIKQISIGKQGVAFDRLDLDEWADQYTHCARRPTNTKRGDLWVNKENNQKCQDYLNETDTGILTKKSLVDEYAKLLAPSRIKTLKPYSLVESKKHDKQ